VGPINGFIASAHIYEYDFGQARLILKGKEINIADKYYSHGPMSIRKK
jgi:thymidylate synthase